jgi:Fic family protein
MKIPLSPPKYSLMIGDPSIGPRIPKIITYLMERKVGAVTDKGKYEHWDKLKYLQPPEDLSPEEWWFGVKFARTSIYKTLPFKDKYGMHMVVALHDIVLQKLHIIDRKAGNPVPALNSGMRNSYLIGSLIEEATRSSQLEGASTTRKVAKEMLKTKRQPRDKSEQMIYNNYQAMQFVQEIKDENITTEAILQLHRILTEKILDDPNTTGHFRESKDNINVSDNSDGTILHIPPDAEELRDRLKTFCDFANAIQDDNFSFIPPVVRAILLHFVLAYDHPFVDGNGRTARALFYWAMAHQGYSLMSYISISRILKNNPRSYARAFLHTETDENDVTYFVLHQLDVILKAIDELYNYLQKKSEEVDAVERLLNASSLKNKLNYRQMALIRHASNHPLTEYRIEIHRQAHGITYQTARTDLLNLEKMELLERRETVKAFVFLASDNLKNRIESLFR